MEEQASQRPGQPVLTLVAEDHVCPTCDIDYSTVTVDDALRTLREVPDQVRNATMETPPERHSQRPDPDTWSIIEYVCHVRDIYSTYTIRLHRARTEELPAVDPMLNDLRARRFRYNERDLAAVLDELAANAAGFREEVARTSDGDWDKRITRLPNETRTARWLVRQAMHEGVHHTLDIIEVGRALPTDSRE